MVIALVEDVLPDEGGLSEGLAPVSCGGVVGGAGGTVGIGASAVVREGSAGAAAVAWGSGVVGEVI